MTTILMRMARSMFGTAPRSEMCDYVSGEWVDGSLLAAGDCKVSASLGMSCEPTDPWPFMAPIGNASTRPAALQLA